MFVFFHRVCWPVGCKAFRASALLIANKTIEKSLEKKLFTCCVSLCDIDLLFCSSTTINITITIIRQG